VPIILFLVLPQHILLQTLLWDHFVGYINDEYIHIHLWIRFRFAAIFLKNYLGFLLTVISFQLLINFVIWIFQIILINEFYTFYFFLQEFVSFHRIKIFTFQFTFSKVSFLCSKMQFHFPLSIHSNRHFYPINLLKVSADFKYSLELDFLIRPEEPLIF